MNPPLVELAQLALATLQAQEMYLQNRDPKDLATARSLQTQLRASAEWVLAASDAINFADLPEPR